MLTIENLEAGYGKVEVLHGISIQVPKGKVVTLIGSNGAGKTTTMRAVSGMIKPTAGKITLGGKDITGMESHQIAKLGLAHSPEGRRVFPTLSVLDNIRLGAFVRYTNMRPKGDVEADMQKALEMFPRLKERTNQLAGTLSGGEQQSRDAVLRQRTGQRQAGDAAADDDDGVAFDFAAADFGRFNERIFGQHIAGAAGKLVAVGVRRACWRCSGSLAGIKSHLCL